MLLSLLFGYLRAEGEEGKLHNFEAEDSLGDSYNRYAMQNSKSEVDDCRCKTKQNEPDKISNGVLACVELYLFSKWEKGYSCYLEALNTEWNTHDCNTENKSEEKPQKRKN